MLGMSEDAVTTVMYAKLKEGYTAAADRNSDVQWPDMTRRGKFEAMTLDCLVALYHHLRDVRPESVQEQHEWICPSDDGDIRVIGFSDWIVNGEICDLKFRGRAPWNNVGEWDQTFVLPVVDQLHHYYFGRLYAAKRDNLPEPPDRGRVVVMVYSSSRRNPEIREYSVTLSRDLYPEIAASVIEAHGAQVSATHPPRPGAACEWCPYVERCRIDSARYAVRTDLLAASPTRV
jgi:hypothetical protein